MTRRQLLAVIVLVTLGVCLFEMREANMQSSTLRRVTNTTEEGINLNPTISGDGRVIGFESTEDIAGAGGTDHFRAIRANITSDPASFFQVAGSRFVAPAISQDGTRIAFTSRDDLLGTNSDGNSEIFLFDGVKLTQVTNTSPGNLANRITNGNFQPSISDDGRFIAFSSNRDLAGQNSDGNLEIFVYDSNANSFTQLTNSSGTVGATDAKISGDGSTVAFIRDNGATTSAARDLIKRPRSGGSATALVTSVPSLALTLGRAISDDGTRVVYSTETATNTTQVFMFDGRSGGGTIRQITSLGARVTEVPLDPTISGDGSRIAFAARRTVSGAGSNSDGGVELYVFDLPTSTFSKITNAPSSATAEVVSSLNDDGSIIAFNFPRVLSGAVTNSGTENNSEIYAIAPPARPSNGTLTAILNDASFGHEPSTTKAIAPNSIALAQGTNLASATAQSSRLADGTFPTNVAGTRVTVNGRAAQIFFVSPTQINFLVPPQTEIGSAEVIVTNAENFPSRGTVSTLRAAPGIFTKTGDGIGEGLILNADTLQEGPFDPTGGNLHLSIFGTGARNAAVTTVTIGGRVVNAEALVASTTMPGLDEIHVRVPADLRGAGVVNLIANSDGRDSNPVTVHFLGDPSRAVLFNEILSDPPNGIAGDANNDGVRDGADDEFVELVNGSAAETIGMSGWTIKTRANGSTTETTRFTFPAGTSLQPGTAAVVFGGGNFNPIDAVFGCAQVFKATSSAGLSLTNTGLTILLRDSAGNLIAQFAYGGSTGLDGNDSQSLTRSPDITGSFLLHTTANSSRRFSPGLKVDGTPFGTCAGRLTAASIDPSSATVGQNQTIQFTARALDQFGRTMTNVPISFTSDNPSVATIDSTSTNSTTGVATANVGAHNEGTAHINATANDGTTAVNSSPATLTVTQVVVIGNALSVNDVSKNEGNSGTTILTFTISLSQPAPSGGVTFDIATQDGTATVANNDYVARALTNQVIPSGAQTYSFDVTVNGDTAVEPNENFFVSVSNVSGVSVSKGQGTGTILNDDGSTLSVSDVTANEGNSGTTTFSFAVTTPVPAGSGGITFDIATADGTATAASGDYIARSLTNQNIPAGQSSYTFNVTVNGDTVVEASEIFFINITNVSGAQMGDGQGQGTILNDDTPSLVVSQVYPSGGLSNATYANDFIEIYNRGTSTVDFSITPYSVQFLSTSGSTWVKTDLTNGLVAPGRYFLIREASGGATGASAPTPDATGTINLTSTTDGKVALVPGTNLLNGNCPGDDGTQPFNPTNVADFVGYGGTAATANHCYEGTGPTSFTLGNNTIAALRKAGGCVDTNDNASDFFTAQPSPRNSSSPIGDCKPEITINDVTVTEGNSGTVNATFTVSLSAASAQTVKVDFATTDGTATTPADYQSNAGTLTFNPGDLTRTITVLVNGDTMDEPNETFFVNLSNAVNAVLLDSQGQGTINDNDAAPSISINDVAVTEGNSGTTAATFTVTLSAASGFTVTVNYATTDNTANAGSDYQAASGVVTFNPGEIAKQVSVQVNGDTDFEQNEGFFVNLSGPVSATIADGQGAGTINNDDPLPPTPNFFINDVTLTEGDGGTTTANFNVTLNPAASQQVTVQYATANGLATAGSDYQSTSGTLTFAPGDTTRTVSVTVNGDTLVEPDETFLVNLSNNSAGTNIGDPQGVGTIQNDDQATLVISQVYSGGGLTGATYANDFVEIYNRATTTVDFSVTPYSIQFLSTGGSTWSKTDLTAGTIAPGHYFLIKEASGGAVGTTLPAADATGTINLTSTTAGKVALVGNTTLLTTNCPGDDGGQPFNPTGAAIADFVGYLGTAATANHCYEGSGPASFTSGSNTTADFRKAGGCLDNNDNANDFFVAQPNPRNTSSPVGDCKPEIVINDVTVTEGNSGTVNATFTVTLTATSAQTVTVDFATADGTATAPADYQTNSGTLTFNPGDTTKTITVLVNGDTLDEANETFFVNLTNPVNAAIVDAQGLGAITDNDPQPSLSINDVSVSEGNVGTTAMNFTVTLAAASGQIVTVNYATADNTATTPSDYQSASGTVTFNPGETTKPITISVNGDTDFEQNEALFVNLSGATNASISDAQGVGTITNDDAAPPTPTFFIDDVSLTEGDSGPATLNFTVTLSPASSQQTTVDFATANGTANSGSDYQSNSGVLTFGIGETTKQVSVTINGDTLVEPDETFLVNLTNATGGAGIGDSQGLGTIQNDDAANIVISQIYPGGGLSNATYANDYIELFNRGATTVDFSVTPFSVQFLSTTGSTWAKTDLTTGTIASGQYFLIKETSGGVNGVALPAADATGTINLTSTTDGKVALVSNTTLLSGNCPGDDGTQPFNPANTIDFVGYGGTAATANHCYEGTGPSSFTLSNNTIADFRKAGGCTDTNNNAGDFFTSTPFPRNSTSTNNCAGGTTPNLSINSVTVTEGNSGATNATFTVTLSPTGTQTLTVQYATVDGTAKSTSDYQSTSGTLTFDPGDSSKTIDVPVNGDLLIEPDETFTITLANASAGSAISPTNGTGTGTIQNDDLALVDISQVYAGGGNTSAPAALYKNDFIEIFNRGATTVDLFGWSVQYSSASGTGNWSVTQLCTTGPCLLAPGQYFLVQEAQGAGGTQNLPTPDAIGTIAMATTSGKVALVSNATALSGACPASAGILDKVGYGGSIATTDFCFEGTGPTPAPSNVNAALRKAGGCTDTNDNASDFFTFAASPRNSSSPTNSCSGAATPNLSINDVTVTEGNSGTTAATFTVSLSAPAQGTDVTFDIATQDNTATTADNDYVAKSLTNQVIPAGQTTYTFSVTVNGDIQVEPDQTFFVNVTNVVGANVTDGQGTGTIQHDDLPSLSINDVSAVEGDSGTKTFSFSVSLSAPAPATVTFDIATQDNTATIADNDYVAHSLTGQTIAAGQQTYQFDVTVNGDTTVEPNETFLVNVSNVSGATVGDGQGLGTIQNDDSPLLSVSDVSINEGNSGATTFTFNVSLNQPAPAGAVTFDIATADGTATTTANDYVAHSLTGQSIPAGQTNYSFDVTVNGDTLVEPNETFFVNVTNVNGATVLDGQGQGTIQNDDTAQLVISQIYPGGGLTGATYTNDFIEVFNRSTTTVDFAITPYSVQFLSTSGSTWAKTDLTSGTMLPGHYFLVKETSGANGAALPTADATGSINITSTTPGKVALVSGTTLLTGNCPGDDGSQPFNPASSTIADFVGYMGNSATANHCYEGTGPASFTSGSNTTADFRKSGGCIDTNDNAADFVVGGPNPRNSATVANDCSTGFRPDISINDVTITEGDSGTANATFNVTLSAANNSQTITVDFTTADGTATAGADYQMTTGTLTFNPGDTLKTISVPVVGDTLDETNETFFVNLSNATNASILDPQGLGTINDNDPTPSLSINDLANITEGNSGTSIVNFTVTLSAASGQTVTVNYATADGTATTANNDYTSTSGTLTFNPGDTQKSVPVMIKGDTVNEPDETFFVNLGGVSVTATISDSQGQGTIKNDDASANADLSVTKSASSAVVVPGNNITYTITVTNNGADPASNVQLNDATPPNTVFASLSSPPAGWTCITPGVNTTGTVTCSVPSLAVSSPATLTLSVKANAGTPFGTQIDNTVLVSSDTADNNSSNNQATATVYAVDPNSADLAITKSDSPDPIGVGTDLTYTINLKNNGPLAAASVSVNDTLPAQVKYRSMAAPPAGWTCLTPAVDSVGGTITCTEPSMNANATASFQITVRVLTTVTDNTVISNTVSVSSSTTDSVSVNNSSTSQTTARTPQLLITQIYPGGGNSGATYTNDFVEIFNRGTTTVDFSLTNFSIQYESAGGATWSKTDLTTGTIAPGQYFLIQEAGGANGVALPTPDATGTINLSASGAAKVALVSGITLLNAACPGDDGTQPFNPNSTTIMDLVGYAGTAATSGHCYIGSGPAPFSTSTNPNARSTIRTAAATCAASTNNSADFTNPTTPPIARNKQTALSPCP